MYNKQYMTALLSIIALAAFFGYFGGTDNHTIYDKKPLSAEKIFKAGSSIEHHLETPIPGANLAFSKLETDQTHEARTGEAETSLEFSNPYTSLLSVDTSKLTEERVRKVEEYFELTGSIAPW